MHRTGLPAASMPSPRSVFVTLLAWTVIVPSALLMPISLISGMMVIAGSHGTASADALGFFTMVLGPPTMLVAGFGLLWRRKWAHLYVMAVLGGIALSNGLNLARNASAPRSYVSPGGVPTTVVAAGQDYVVPTAILVVLCAGLLVALILPKVREEFGFGIGHSRRAAAVPTVAAPPAAAATRSAISDRERGWRVGHRGRDLMVYEEWREGAWQRIDTYVDDQAPPAAASVLGSQREPAATASRPSPAGTSPRAPATEPRKPRLNTAVAVAVTVLLVVSLTSGWLVGRGLVEGETFLPIKRATQRRIVVAQEEPAAFWIALGLYSALGVGTLGAAVWLLRETVRSRPYRPH